MQKDVLTPQHLEEIHMRRKRGIARRLKRTILKFRKRIVGNQRREMSHRQRTIQFVSIGFG